MPYTCTDIVSTILSFGRFRRSCCSFLVVDTLFLDVVFFVVILARGGGGGVKVVEVSYGFTIY